MYFSERIKSENLPSMPYIEMQIKKTYYSPADVAARVRKKESYIDLHFYCTDTDSINREEIGKKVKDFLQNAVRVNQETFDEITFANIESDAYLAEQSGSQLIYHYVLTVFCLWYDICT